MTFAEELKNISDGVVLEIDIASHCDIIKNMMREVAGLGVRSFQIDIICPHSANVDANEVKADNYHTIFINKNYSIKEYEDSIMYFLMQQGFSKHTIEVAHITNFNYTSSLISVRW